MLTFTFIQGHMEDMTYFKIVFIGEWGIFGAEVFLRYSRFFIKGNFVIGRVECIWDLIPCHIPCTIQPVQIFIFQILQIIL